MVMAKIWLCILILFMLSLSLNGSARTMHPLLTKTVLSTQPDDDETIKLKHRQRLIGSDRQTLSIAEIDLHLGMTSEEIINDVAGKYRIDRSNDSFWVITSLSGPPFEIYGSLSLERGRLVNISKYWGAFSSDEVYLLCNTMFTSLSKRTGQKAAIDTTILGHKLQKNFAIHRIDFDFGNGGISISFWSEALAREILDKVSITEHIKHEQILPVGSKMLWYGMSKDAVIKQLEDLYLIEELNKNVWVINSEKHEEFMVLAYFKEDRLTGISQGLGEVYGEAPNRLAELLFYLISSFNEQDNYQATIKAVTIEKDNLNVKKIILDFGMSKIKILILEGEGVGRQISIQEDLGL
jgi:hypothetical protein